jgi:hypothetical protein
MFHESQTWDFMAIKKNYLYILYKLILSNPLHLTIKSKLILIQNELWIPKSYCANSKVFCFCLK